LAPQKRLLYVGVGVGGVLSKSAVVFSLGGDVDENSTSVVLMVSFPAGRETLVVAKNVGEGLVEFPPEVSLLGEGEGITVAFALAGLEVELPEYGLDELAI
jgi:hypothetical protein